MERKFTSLSAFYPYYLSEHQNLTCRRLHFAGTTCFFGFLLYALITQKWIYLLGCPLSGYGFAWIGHFVYEKNKPATFQYPFYSLASDFIMYFDTILGRLPAKLVAAKAQYGES